MASLDEESTANWLRTALRAGVKINSHLWSSMHLTPLRRTSIEMRYSSIEDVQEDLVAADVGPERDMDIDIAVAHLNGRVQQVVRAMGIEGASVAETGSRLDISENAVRVAFHRGLTQLEKLRSLLIGESDQSR